MTYADQFEQVATPPFTQRFEWKPGRSIKIRCVVCHAEGYGIPGEDPGFRKWWANSHNQHVRCTCGKIVSAKGLGAHVGSMRRHGNPCPFFEVST
jgi:hypothetical protein